MKFIKFTAALLTIIIAAGLGLTSLITTPAPAAGDAAIPDTEFSALRAAEHIRVIAKDVHTNADTAAIAAVREYLKTTLEGLGLEVELRKYDKDYEEAGRNYGNHVTAVDICGTLRGTNERSLLLVAHYDSNPGLGIGEAPGSHGASDDAYGVAVILETLRCVKARGNITNTIRVVFTDAEETSMLGSSALAADRGFDAAASDAVLNMESRGLSGPAVLFETSKGNAALMDFYAAHARHPATWSLATDVYRVMPNYTDFTAFLDLGMPGLNFSNLYRIDDNHRPADVFENISYSALQDYGEQVMPVVAAYAANKVPATFVSEDDHSWFTLFRGFLVIYPSYWNVVLLGVAVFLLLVYVIAAGAMGRLKFRRLLNCFVYLGFALVAAALGTGLAYLLALIFKLPISLMNLVGLPYADYIMAGLTVLLGLFLVMYMHRRRVKGYSYEDTVVPAILLSTALAALLTFVMPGGAFLFSFGAIIASLIGLLSLSTRVMRLFTGFAAVWVAAPVVVLLYVSLTPWAFGVVLLFAAFPLLIAAPSLADAFHGKADA